jgi:inhibitor of KinA sporulation pathway (predicted exonuclease)
MFFTGYPTETLDDHKETIKLLNKYKQYAKTVISKIQAGFAMVILPGSPLYSQSQNDPNMILTKHTNIWFNQNNKNLTFEERQRRRIEFSTVAQDLGYTMTYDDHDAIDDMKNVQKLYNNVISIIQR